MRRTTIILTVIIAASIVTWLVIDPAAAKPSKNKNEKLVIVTLNLGGEVTGVLKKETDDFVVVETMAGVVKLKWEDIESVDEGNPAQLYKKQVKKSDPTKAGDQFRLAMWCKRFFKKEYKKHLKKCLDLDSEHMAAQEELGLYKWEGKWLSWELYNKARGFVQYKGRYYPQDVVDKYEAGLVRKHGRWVLPGAGKTTTPVAREITVPTDIAGLLETIDTGDHAHRVMACKEIAAKPDGGKILTQELPKLVAKKEDAVKAYFKSKAGSLRKEIYVRLVDARKYARGAIFDKKIYPDADHGRVGQPEVDKRVGKVRLLWEQPLTYALAKKTAIKKKWEDLLDLVKIAREYITVPSEGGLKIRMEKECAGIINIRKYCAPRGSFDTLKFNKTTSTTITDDERGVLDFTNEYRMMMGFSPFRVNEKLVQCARGHSTCMRDNNFFSHGCKIHGNMGARGRAAGTSVRGENIARGQQSAYQAYIGWYRSSGHHRNLLGGFRSLGVGKAGVYWTQNFL